MIAEILPPAVASAHRFDDALDTSLFPEEEALLARAVDKRRREFATGRACARAALAQLGLPRRPILPGPRGAPVWPDGVVGSITHCAGYRAAAVARAGDIVSIGVDAEPNEPLPGNVLDLVCDERERAQLAGLAAAAPEVCWDRLLFSAKESVYKAWFPVTARWLDFADVTVSIRLPDRGFSAWLLVPGAVVTGAVVTGRELTGFTGRWLVRGGLLLTAVTVLGEFPPAASPILEGT